MQRKEINSEPDRKDIHVHDSGSGERDVSFDNVITPPNLEPEPGDLCGKAKKNSNLVAMLGNTTSAQAQSTRRSPHNRG